MAKNDERRMPSGFAGLTRYFDESPEVVKLTPQQMIVLTSSLIAFVGILKILL